jgi:hypothetical protein
MLESAVMEIAFEFEPGDYIKFEIIDDKTAESEWMRRVDSCDESKKVVFGWLDRQPIVFKTDLKLGQHLAVSFDNIREHRKKSDTW